MSRKQTYKVFANKDMKNPIYLRLLLGVYEEDLDAHERESIIRRLSEELNSLNPRLKELGLPIIVATRHKSRKDVHED